MNTWFTSDTHFGHANIITYCNRPFQTVEEMNAKLISNWNERVKKEDVVYHLGDFCFKKSSEAPEGSPFDYYRNQLNGEIILIRGNHDKNNKCRSALYSAIINHGGQTLFLIHDPARYPYQRYKIVLCGHVHEKWKFKKVIKNNSLITFCNVGVDVWNFRPVNINEILGERERWKKLQETP
jgi:calcineurin-like phosphoesterase family protein